MLVKQERILVHKWAEGLANSIKASGVFKRNECKYSADLYKSGDKKRKKPRNLTHYSRKLPVMHVRTF